MLCKSNAGLFIALVVYCISICLALTPSEPLTDSDKQRLLLIFEHALLKKHESASLYNSIIGYQQLNIRKFPNSEVVCQHFSEILKAWNKKSIESIFHSLDGANRLDDCHSRQFWPTANELKPLKDKLIADVSNKDVNSNAKNLWHTVKSLTLLGSNIPVDQISTHLNAILKKDTSAANLLYIFSTASTINLKKDQLKPFFLAVEDAVQQMDESDNLYLYFEDGLYLTGMMVDAIYKLSEKYGELPKVSDEKLLKLTNYLLSRRFVYTTQSAASLVTALRTLSANKHIVPACIHAYETSLSGQDNSVAVSITNVWNEPIKTTKFKADKLVNKRSKKPVADDKSSWSLSFNAKTNMYEFSVFNQVLKTHANALLQPGYYSVRISADGASSSPSPRYVGIKSGKDVNFKILADSKKLRVGPVEVQHEESDSSSSSNKANAINLNSPSNAIEKKLQIDSQSKLRIKLNIATIDKNAKQGFQPHQVFLRLQHAKMADREMILVLTPMKSSDGDLLQAFRAVLDPRSQAKDFGYQSGEYDLELLIGDALMERTIKWKLGRVNIKLPEAPRISPAAQAAKVQWADAPLQPNQSPLPLIDHKFRQPDRRAPKWLALMFVGLCALPILVLLVWWLTIGINLDGLSETPISSIGFHVCLAGIFVTYGVYWLALDMFNTLGWTLLLGIPTFLFGNVMLRGKAALRLDN